MAINEDDPVTLQEACDIVYRGLIKPSTLRLMAERGHVEIFRVGRRWLTTLGSVRLMKDKCPGNAEATGRAAESREDQLSTSLVALGEITKRLKQSARKR